MPSNKTIGVIAVLGASMMWAFEPILAKLSFQSTDVLSTFATRILFCLIIITIYALLKNPRE
ncbi:MAG: EamA family transporter, partial [candidate division WOR-3 bacterium]